MEPFYKRKNIIIIIILVVFNVLLLYTNSNLQSNLKELEETQSQQPIPLENNYVVDEVINNPKTSGSVGLLTADLTLFVLFPDKSCTSCLAYEVPNLSNFYQGNEGHVRAYTIGKSLSLERFGASFPVESIHLNDSLDIEFNFSNPFALLVDSNGMIQQTYIAEVGNKEKSTKFYQRMSSLFESIE